MILAVDVYYYEAGAKVVGVLFESFDSKAPIDIIEKLLPPQKEYEPGAFYKRELPCILELVNMLNREYIELIIVDGYVYLDDHKKKGLGSYVFEALGASKGISLSCTCFKSSMASLILSSKKCDI
ncbi:hypothetical protein [Myroides sp. NP-2]|uniref:hypothetical protein n=1 Tax=Myroides sp. NP-2 TaxID=2759945 RepID=UPI0034CF9796